eukprot:UN06582
MDNAGVFAVASRQTVLAGNEYKKKRNDRQSKGMRINGSGLLFTNNRKKRDPWIGQTVKITKGNHKGYLGIVKATTDRHLQVELHAKPKTVNIKRESVKKCTKGGEIVGSGDVNDTRPAKSPSQAQTPRYIGARTPAYGDGASLGSATPFLGSATPMQGSQTPGYAGMPFGGDTPGYGGATPNYGNSTPGYGGQTPGYGGQTPHYAATPAYGGMTPAYDGSQTPKVDGSGQTPVYSRTPNYQSGTPSGDSSQYSNPGSAYSNNTWRPDTESTSPGTPYNSTSYSPQSSSAGPDTPMVPTSQNNTQQQGTVEYNNYDPNNTQSMFTPNGPHTPQPQYDPSDMSDNAVQATSPLNNNFCRYRLHIIQ